MADGEPETGYELEGVNFWGLAWAESRKVCSREAAFSKLVDIILGRRIHKILFNRKREGKLRVQSCHRFWIVPSSFLSLFTRCRAHFCCDVVPCESRVPSNDLLCRWTIFHHLWGYPNSASLAREDCLLSWFTWWRITCWTDVLVHICSTPVQSGAETRDSSAQSISCAQGRLSWLTNQAMGNPGLQELQVQNSDCTLDLINSGLDSSRLHLGT